MKKSYFQFKFWNLLPLITLLILIACGDEGGDDNGKDNKKHAVQEYNGTYLVAFKTEELPAPENGNTTRTHIKNAELVVTDGVGKLTMNSQLALNINGAYTESPFVIDGNFTVNDAGKVEGTATATAFNLTANIILETGQVSQSKAEGTYYFEYQGKSIAKGSFSGSQKVEGEAANTEAAAKVAEKFDGLYQTQFSRQKRVDGAIEEDIVLVACFSVQAGVLTQTVEPSVFAVQGSINKKGMFTFQPTSSSQIALVGNGVLGLNGGITGTFDIDGGFSGSFSGDKVDTCPYETINPPRELTKEDAEGLLEFEGGFHLPNLLKPTAEELAPEYHILCNVDIDTSSISNVFATIEIPLIGDVFSKLDRGDKLYCKKSNRCGWLDDKIAGFSNQQECLDACTQYTDAPDLNFTECKGMQD